MVQNTWREMNKENVIYHIINLALHAAKKDKTPPLTDRVLYHTKEELLDTKNISSRFIFNRMYEALNAQSPMNFFWTIKRTGILEKYSKELNDTIHFVGTPIITGKLRRIDRYELFKILLSYVSYEEVIKILNVYDIEFDIFKRIIKLISDTESIPGSYGRWNPDLSEIYEVIYLANKYGYLYRAVETMRCFNNIDWTIRCDKLLFINEKIHNIEEHETNRIILKEIVDNL
jgi:hypothetical protein